MIYGSLQLTQKWKDEVISLDPTGQPIINVITWFSRAALDIIGEGKCYVLPCSCDGGSQIPCVAGFDFHFGSLDNERTKTQLASQYENLL